MKCYLGYFLLSLLWSSLFQVHFFFLLSSDTFLIHFLSNIIMANWILMGRNRRFLWSVMLNGIEALGRRLVSILPTLRTSFPVLLGQSRLIQSVVYWHSCLLILLLLMELIVWNIILVFNIFNMGLLTIPSFLLHNAFWSWVYHWSIENLTVLSLELEI